ncbi:helix-turn-helix domain-containing protein [Staphylococcus agnetis]|uniref:XRE family transcriptional regulator n=1 Tax=Staphylococcus agnetis TaxID=985762 RepID=A0ABD7TSL9_9STAP|nr:XRE family transcriptional regulator [Staphylococcus agnetis]UXU56542.1 XRE family transcriptional regulator [Staphylococcus agnetis]UXU58862.1 XRE family transcriptional regulator [Staphylococcus agnetis]UXU61187.1 XRE family transcriptional regulator [Staphylococcus agnetis]
MTSFSSNLERLMNRKDMSDSDLAALVDVNRTTVTRWRKGIRSPKLDKLPEIANVFGVEPLDLISESNNQDIIVKINDVSSQLTPPRQQNVLNYAHGQLEEQNDEVNNIVHMTKLKRIHASAAGVVGEELFDDIYEEEIEFEADKVPKGADYCVLVNGDSMEPMIRDGSCAFIKKTDTVSDGTIALVIVDGAGYIKRVDIYDDVIRLVSLNPKYEDIIVQSHHDMKVFGKVVL